MLEVLDIVAHSWPIAVMVVALVAAFVIRRCFRQAMENNDTIRNLRAERSVVPYRGGES